MSMFNLPHAGMLIKDVIETKGISATELPCALKLQDSTVAKLLNGELNISEEMARSLDLNIENAHSLWRTKNTINFPEKNLEP